jgi:DNA helicase-2/ATP-dependent DNA helicase PcrA
LDPPDATSAEAGPPLLDEDYLTLSTIHSAKGQEWTAVFIINANDGNMPSDLSTGDRAQIEEERRLLYVAMTRAKAHLHVVHPHKFYKVQQQRFGDAYVFAPRTRFIPNRILELFEVKSWPERATAASGSSRTTAKVDVAARMREMWR